MFGKLFGRRAKEEPVPEHIRFVGECLEKAQEIGADYAMKLDYSVDSISAVSGLLDSYHRRYLHPEEDNGVIRDNADNFATIFGVYIGETLLRLHPDSGYSWTPKEQFGLVVAKGEGYHIDAIAKAAKQIVNGREAGDEVGSFFDIAEQLMEGKWPQG